MLNKKIVAIDNDYLSLDGTMCLKGILAVCILLHHLYQRTSILLGTVFGGILQSMGYLSVAGFFFITGYGLMAQYMHSRKRYMAHFLRNRILSLYIMYLMTAVLYLIYNLWCGGIEVSILSIIKTLTFGGTIVENGWYIQAVFIVYIAFYMIFRLSIQDDLKVALMFLATIFYCILCLIMNLPNTWYESIFAVVLGIAWCRYRNKIDNMFSGYIPMLVGMIFLFCTSFLLYRCGIFTPAISVLFEIVSALAFAALVTLLIVNVSIRCRITRFLGAISFEIYVLQGLFMSALRNVIHNDYVYILSVIPCVLIGSFVYHQIIKRVNKYIKR